MEIKLKKSKDVYIIDVSGEMDLYNAHRLKDVFQKMAEKQIRKVIINLADVEYIDSSGVGTLIHVHSSAKRLNISLLLANVHGTVQKVLQLTKLVGYFPICTSVEDAIQAM